MSRLHCVTSCGAPGFQVFPIPRFPILRHCRKTVGRQNRQPRQRRGKRRTAKTAKTKTPSFIAFFSCREQPPKPPKCFDLRDHRKPAVAFRRIPKHGNVQHLLVPSMNTLSLCIPSEIMDPYCLLPLAPLRLLQIYLKQSCISGTEEVIRPAGGFAQYSLRSRERQALTPKISPKSQCPIQI